MLIEQNIEFELRGPGPSDRTCTPTTGQFHDKAKISKENRRVDYYLRKAEHHASPYLGRIAHKI